MEYYICFIWLKYSKQIVWQNDKLDAQASLVSFLAYNQNNIVANVIRIFSCFPKQTHKHPNLNIFMYFKNTYRNTGYKI